MKTKPEIEAEINRLEECKAYVPPRTVFGEDNHLRINIQIETLWGEFDTTTDEFDQLPERTRDAIMEASLWKDGDVSEPPSSGWSLYKPERKK